MVKKFSKTLSWHRTEMIWWNKPFLAPSSLLNWIGIGELWALCARYAENRWKCWQSGIQRMPGSSLLPSSNHRVLPATEAEIDLDGRQLISRSMYLIFQGRQLKSVLKVSVAPLSTVSLRQRTVLNLCPACCQNEGSSPVNAVWNYEPLTHIYFSYSHINWHIF